MKKYLSKIIFALAVIAFIIACAISAPIEQAIGTLWSLLPPIVAIGLALITKEVYSSLFIGIITGGVIFSIATSGGFEGVFNAVVNDGLIANLADTYNVGILIFLVVLGIIVVLMNKAGGSRAYGEWASAHIKSRKSASFATFLLGALIFVDDYFNCLTVGSVMRPVTDKHKISRSKLAYLIDSTAAPICIIAPISSWAAAVAGTVDGVNGIQLFISTIPYNLYALLSIIMVIFISLTDFDFGPMKHHEDNARNGDLFTTRNNSYPEDDKPTHTKGKVIDLIIPVAFLIIFCVVGMIYTGGFFSGENFMDAFANCDASFGLSLGSIGALIVAIIYFIIRRVLTFSECMDSIAAGFKQMVPAILILTFAWTLKTMTSMLEAGPFVSGLVQSATALQILLPFILFIVAIGLSFATGTSWGTFGILIPIVTSVFSVELADTAQTGVIPSMVIICISACLAGAVCGDHCSPISDTTIMASTGAQCDHVNHVSTQLPYAITVAAVCAVGYIISGFIQNVFVVLGVSALMMVAVLYVMRLIVKKTATSKK
ncbi:MAG: Na+/H+ antiporter NhaC family protein [Oscillospiraceae bacterium]